jgi:hypothetical protein
MGARSVSEPLTETTRADTSRDPKERQPNSALGSRSSKARVAVSGETPS